MAKGTYVGVNNVARKVKKMYVGVGGVARKVKKGYIGVNGVARLFYQSEAHTSQSTWNPVDASSLWARVLIPEPETIPGWIQPDSTNPYMMGDKVTHNEKTWVSNIDNNVWEPGVYGWDEVTE